VDIESLMVVHIYPGYTYESFVRSVFEQHSCCIGNKFAICPISKLSCGHACCLILSAFYSQSIWFSTVPQSFVSLHPQ